MTSSIAVVRSAAPTMLSSVLVVIDPGVTDYQSFASRVLSGAKVLVLNPDQDGVEQITTALQQHPEITNLHIVAHGSPACMYLGNNQLSLKTMEQYAWDLQSWFSSSPLFPCSPTPSLYLYAYDVAIGNAGSEFLQKLHTLTGATIHTSSIPVGDADQGGIWELNTHLPE